MLRLWLALLLLSAVGYYANLFGANPENREFTKAERNHWAFQDVGHPAIPKVVLDEWTRNPIDAFIFRELQSNSIAPSIEADRRTLIRRASFDLRGLPPSPDEVAAFVADETPDAYERLIDGMLSSPSYGERWARHWLDLALFAESAGFEQDETRPNAWRYRDYVLNSFNLDKPYDRFLTEQIAGDEVWPDDLNARMATAFMRHYPEEGNNKDILLARQEILHHVTDLVGSTFMGLTFNCAQCHDHKYDPILQKDYYRLQAFFANIGHDDQIPLVAKNELDEYEERLAEYERRTESLWDEMDQLLSTVRKYSPKQLLARYPDYVIEAMSQESRSRNPLQSQIAYIVNHKDCGTCPQRPKPHADPSFQKDANGLKDSAKKRFAELKSELEKLSHLKPKEIPRAMGIIDISHTAPTTHVLGVGLYTSPQIEVQPGVLSILDPTPTKIEKPAFVESTGRRTTFAKWLTDPQNPLTARVMVNRVWHHHFGRGIVGTPSDFGVTGDRPSHPELLDWLADRFIRHDWSIKDLHRLIMTSATYRQNSAIRNDVKRDPNNRLLWRFPPQRLDAETIRDGAMAVTGLLNRSVGGPSVFPPLPEGKPTPLGGWKVSSNPSDHVRRSLYVFVRRNDRFPMLEAFDFPDTHESCACRNQTLTVSQALTMLNSETTSKWSDAFAKRLNDEASFNPTSQIDHAYQLAFSRSPDQWEIQEGLEFLKQQKVMIADEQEKSQKDVASDPSQEALADYCLMLLNSNEFIFRY